MNELKLAIEQLKRGGVVAYPTDTAYGLAVDATNLAAVKRLYALKGRNWNKAVSVIFPNLNQAARVVIFNSTAKVLANKFLPGALTLVLPLKSKTKNWRLLSANTRALGIRVPANETAMDLARGLGRPITATSANVSGQPTAYDVPTIKKQFARAKRQPDFYLDGDRLQKNSISTILQIDGRHVTLIREGDLGYHEILKALK